MRGLFNGLPLRCIALGLTVPVFAIEPCRSALARLRTIARELDNTRFWHGWSEGLAHGITQSSAANFATGTFGFAASITIVQFPGVRIYAPGAPVGCGPCGATDREERW